MISLSARLAIVVLVIATLAGAAVAVDPPRPNAGLEVIPLRHYFSQDPGSTLGGTIQIANLTEGELRVGVSAETFGVRNEDYDYSFTSGGEAEWIRFADSEIVLAPMEKKSVAYSVAMPSTASPGGHYFALIATTQVPTSSTDVTESKRVASLVYIEVTGALVKDTELLSFDMPWLSTARDISIDSRYANTGNVHVRPRLGLSLKAWPFGRTVRLGSIEALILPGSVRHTSNSFRLPSAPAIYQLSAEYTPPQGGVVYKTRYVIFLPLWSVFALSVVIGTAIYALKRRKLAKPPATV